MFKTSTNNLGAEILRLVATCSNSQHIFFIFYVLNRFLINTSNRALLELQKSWNLLLGNIENKQLALSKVVFILLAENWYFNYFISFSTGFAVED